MSGKNEVAKVKKKSVGPIAGNIKSSEGLEEISKSQLYDVHYPYSGNISRLPDGCRWTDTKNPSAMDLRGIKGEGRFNETSWGPDR